MNRTMFYLMSWVREKLEKKQINNETPRHWGGKGERRRGMGGKERKKKKKGEKKGRELGLRLRGKQVRGTF